MNKYYVREKCDAPMVIALGFFDCIHLGHKAIIDEAIALAGKLKAETAITTFANDPNPLLKKKPQVYTILEREIAAKNIGVQNIVYSYFNEDFAACSPDVALDILTGNFNIKGVVAGRDFTYGKDAGGNVSTLKDYMEKKGIKVKIVPFEKLMSKKVATTTIKRLIAEGQIEMVNTSLTQPYFQVGTIIHGRNRGAILGFPTANLSVHPDNLKLSDGAYATRMFINGKAHIGITNIGAKPTFGEQDYTIETYLFDFNEDIYGANVRLEFHKKLRNSTRFKSIPALKAQILADEKEARDYFYK